MLLIPSSARLLSILLLVLAASVAAQPSIAPESLWIPHQRFVLDNGLTVLVHEDRSVPVVSVHVWYKVGSRDERAGRTGFAHLFEHFFFNGSENHPFGFREAMDAIGANNRNGTTSQDRTNFFQDVPVSALERTLYLEADRMGFLAGQVSEAMLERERGVVKNEKRQRENQPYGGVFGRMNEMIYPAGHPYSWSPIGRMEDLEAATLDDVRDWYRRYYGPSNAVLALAGDIDVERARELTERYFGAIAPGVPLARLQESVPRLDATLRDHMHDRVPQTALLLAWHLPPRGRRETHAMELLAAVLAGRDNARLDRRLRFEQERVTRVNALVAAKQLSSLLVVQAYLRPGSDAREVEEGIDVELQRLLEEGPTEVELALARNRLLAQFARSSERVGGRAQILADSETLEGDSGAYRRRLADLGEIGAGEVREVARQWLNQPAYRLRVDPFPAFRAGVEQIDRSQLPALGPPPAVAFPPMQRFQLDNGLSVLLLQRAGSPLVQLSLVIDAGSASDPPDQAGIASFATGVLAKGTRRSDAFALAERLDGLGATLWAGNSLDLSFLGMQTLRGSLQASLDLLAEVVREPAFAPSMIDLVRGEQRAAIAQALASPMSLAQRVAPALLFGAVHPYGRAWDGLGDAASLERIDRESLLEWHGRWFLPGQATLVVAGDIDRAGLEQALDGGLARWQPGPAAGKTLEAPAPATAGRLFVVDRPGASQSTIIAARLAPAQGEVDELALESVLRNFGGMATSRLNRNLRLDKHWSYGSSARLVETRGPRPFLVIAPVQTDRTREALLEVHAEIRGLAGERPIGGEEFDSLMHSEVSRLPARFETLGALVNAGNQVAVGGRDEAFYQDYAARLRALQPAQLNAAAAAAVDPEDLLWVVIGDWSRIEEGLRQLDLGEPIRLDAELR